MPLTHCVQLPIPGAGGGEPVPPLRRQTPLLPILPHVVNTLQCESAFYTQTLSHLFRFGNSRKSKSSIGQTYLERQRRGLPASGLKDEGLAKPQGHPRKKKTAARSEHLQSFLDSPKDTRSRDKPGKQEAQASGWTQA